MIDSGDRPDEEVVEERFVHRFRPGFAWGLATGSILIILIFVFAGMVMFFTSISRFSSESGPSTTVVVSPTKAGKVWFTVKPNGTGTLQGWSAGSSGSGGGAPGEPKGTVAFFDVGQLDSQDGVRVIHNVSVYLTRKTQIVVGDQPYGRGKAKSPAEAMFDEGNESMGGDVLYDRLLTVDFHIDGDDIVADRVTAPLESSRSPLQQY